MANYPTSLKLPAKLKERIDRLARQEGETPHALMVRALESHVEAMELHEQFVRDGLAAEKEMQETGLGYAAEDVHAYIRARARGRKVKRPKPVRWRD
jgi:predicted transcriptional regulator